MYLTTLGLYYNHPMMDGRDFGPGAGAIFFWFIFLVVMAIGVIYLLKGHSHTVTHQQKPLDIAKERYAKGEITKTEFEQIKKDL